MFDYLSPEQVSGFENLSLERFVELYFSQQSDEMLEFINVSLEKVAARNLGENLWRDLCLHYFKLPLPYYLGSEELFLFFYENKTKIERFLAESSLTESKLAEIEQYATEKGHEFLAVCFSLSFIERYKAAGHLVCVNTYKTILKHCAQDMRGLFATQAYFHALLLKRQFRASKQIWIDLGWKSIFKQNYGSSKDFVASVFSQIKSYLTKQEQAFAEALAEKTY